MTSMPAPWNIVRTPTQPPTLRRRDAVTAAALAVAFLVAGAWIYGANAPAIDIIATELGGHRLRGGIPDGTSSALWWDFTFIAGYGLALAIGVLLARWLGRTPMARRIVRIGAVAAIVAVVADCVENALLLTVAENDLSSGWRGLVLDGAATSAVLKFCMVLPAAAVALTAVALIVIRSITNSRENLAEWAAKTTDDSFWPPRPVEGDPDSDDTRFDPEPNSGVRWRNGFDLPDSAEQHRTTAATGFCLSGGGIRAGCVAMGALQELRPQLLKADYLVSVSGGGFTAGALVQALTGPDRSDRSQADEPLNAVVCDPTQALMPGSADENHIRNRSSYLAATSTQLMLALGMILQHLLLTVAVLFGPAVVAGALTGWFYKYVPVARFGAGDGNPSFHFATGLFPIPAFVALGVVALVIVGIWLAEQWAIAHQNSARSARLSHAVNIGSWLAAVIVAVCIVIPLLVCTADWLLGSNRVTRISIGGPVVSLVLTYASTIAAIAWRNRKAVSKAMAATKGTSPVAAVPTGVTQRLLVALALTVIAAGWLLLFAGMVRTFGDPAALWAALGVGLGVVILGGVIDETTLSLHPFYRRRIASAFAVRTIRRAHDKQIVAAGYPPEEMTPLATYGRAASTFEFPSVIFAATANVNGNDRTPPGRNCTSYTFNADWVGGPDVGWVRTHELSELATPRLRRDLTVQGAVAISGAAFASAMGKGARWSQLLLAISGARLGAWLPNPTYLQEAVERARDDDWLNPRLPSTRRLSYLLRELFNGHPHTDRLLQITDGGHYDNLGLVELLRRRCELIYCIDASGDTPPTATTLAQAIALAQDELGVKITLDDHAFACEQGMGRPIQPEDPLRVLNARLSRTPIVTGRIEYPSALGPPLTGRLVVAKALLWRELPYWLLSYAAKHPVFPHDSTGDQWFDAGQFSAYAELGRQLGMRIRASTHPPARGPDGAGKAPTTVAGFAAPVKA